MNIIKTNLPESPCYVEGRAPFLSLYSLNGSCVALNLAHVDRITFIPDQGITVTNGKQRLTVTGINLQPLFEAIAAGQITTIRAVDPTGRSLDRGKTWVERVAHATDPDGATEMGS